MFKEKLDAGRAFSFSFPIPPRRYPKGHLLFLQFQSHQIFHVLVVAAAFVHFYGVSNLQEFRYGLEGGCTDDSLL